MKHPAINQSPELAPGSAIPWSADGERELRRTIKRTWHEMWILYVAGVIFIALGFLVQRWWVLVLGASPLGYGITRLYALALLREKLGEEMRRGPRGEFFEGSGMLANKPRNTQSLTQWIQHHVSQERFFCSHLDGRPTECFSWATDAKWIPNYDPDLFEDFDNGLPRSVDPGGGRFVILCPCGLGHFKLKGDRPCATNG
jgi:hypothetical protein